MDALEWREVAGGTFVAYTANFTLEVRRTANRHHVRFKVEKYTGALLASGTTVDVGTAMYAAEKMAERLSPSRKSGRALLMVIDGDQEMRGAIADVLRNGGYDVVEAANGEGALRRLERLPQPVGIITDLSLSGGMDGLEVAAATRKLRPGTGILFISSEPERAGRVSNAQTLAKPFSAEQLLEHVAALVNRARSATHSLGH